MVYAETFERVENSFADTAIARAFVVAKTHRIILGFERYLFTYTDFRHIIARRAKHLRRRKIHLRKLLLLKAGKNPRCACVTSFQHNRVIL